MRNLSVIKGLYQGNGVTRRWAIPFEYNDTAQIFVTITTYDEGDYTYRVLDRTEYTIDEDSVEIVYPKTVDDEPIPSTQYLTVWRDTDLLQLMDLTNQGAAWPDSIEASLDKLHQIVQELAEGLSRSLKVDIGDPQTPDEKLVAIQDYVLAAAESSRSASSSAVSANQAAESAATSAANAAESERLASGYADTASDAASRAEDSAISARAYNAPDYDNETTYQAGDVVTFTDGNSYRAIQETTGNEPPNIIYWQKVTDYVGDDYFEVDEYGYIVPMDSPSHSRYWRVDQNGYIVPIEGGDGGYRPDTRSLSAEYLNVTNEGYVKHLRADDVNVQDLSATGNVTAGMVTTPQANVNTLTAGNVTANDIRVNGELQLPYYQNIGSDGAEVTRYFPSYNKAYQDFMAQKELDESAGTLTVATFNVFNQGNLRFVGARSYYIAARQTLVELMLKAQVIGLNEIETSIDALYTHRYNTEGFYSDSNMVECNFNIGSGSRVSTAGYIGGEGMFSVYELTDKTNAIYAEYTSESEKQGYSHANVTVGNKTVSIYATHFDYRYTHIAAQITELMSVIANDSAEYKIVMGDFNFLVDEDTPRIEQFTSNGFKFVNGGQYKTTRSGKALDEIAVTTNINILDSGMIDIVNIKAYENGGTGYAISDHNPVYARLAFN